MALTRLQLGELYYQKHGVLERKFLGCVLNHNAQIIGGGYVNPNANQLAWSQHVSGCTFAEKTRIAREVMEWGLANNTNLQDQGEALADGALDWITEEYTKTWTAE